MGRWSAGAPICHPTSGSPSGGRNQNISDSGSFANEPAHRFWWSAERHGLRTPLMIRISKQHMIHAKRLVRVRTAALVCVALVVLGIPSIAQQRLVVVGGGKRPPEAMKKFVEWAGGKAAYILVIPWATS